MPTLVFANWLKKASQLLNSSLSFIIFIFLDFLDFILCFYFYYIDGYLEGKSAPCYCKIQNVDDDNSGDEVSETLYMRKNVFRKMGLCGEYVNPKEAENGVVGNRWSDCSCETCVSWMRNADRRLFVHVKEPSQANIEHFTATPEENVVFLHGFLSSSSFWTKTIFPLFSESVNDNYRLFAMDLLGFGRSPKPRDCIYTLRDHIQMIEESVILPFQLKSFHLVAHSMGCVLALAIASKYPNTVKSVTLVAPPYFPSSNTDAGTIVLKRLAGKSLWPPILFGAAVMSWYEHLGRCVCFLICRNHRTWEKILKLLTRRRDVHFLITNLTQHTHHSAWHTMHNVICGGVKYMDGYLETLRKSGVKISVIVGSQDQVVPLECSDNIKAKVPESDIRIIANVDHGGVILERQSDFARDLELIWMGMNS